MAFVLDASITECWAFQDEDHPDAGLAFHEMRAEEAVVPRLWWFEVSACPPAPSSGRQGQRS